MKSRIRLFTFFLMTHRGVGAASENSHLPPADNLELRHLFAGRRA